MELRQQTPNALSENMQRLYEIGMVALTGPQQQQYLKTLSVPQTPDVMCHDELKGETA